MDKSAIRNFAIEARKMLMKSAETEAGFYGITKNGCQSPVQKGNDFEVYETIAGTENRIYGADIKRRANLVKAVETLGFEQVIEETAYTWFNRIIAIRFMEVNDYLPTRVRVLSSETGNNTPDIVTQSLDVDLNMTPEELEKVQKAKDENRYDDAFRMLFIKQCNELNAILPGLFEKTDDYMELLLKLSYTSDGVVRMLVDSIDENNFNVETEGQVEIIGWMYQYYNTELKDDTFAKIKENVKVTKERIPAATQLFTPDWIVRYMVENSVGRVWIEHLRALDSGMNEKEKANEFGWRYYLPEAEQKESVKAQLIEKSESHVNLEPQDIKCIDPCMGSGHVLVYMFDVLMEIYRSEGFNERDAVFNILEHNIRGLDIDKRAYQLSYFALMMKARGYNRTFFRGKQDEEGIRIFIEPVVLAIDESNNINQNQLRYFGTTLDEIERNNALNQIIGLLDDLKDARELGSIANVGQYDWFLLEEFAQHYAVDGQISFDTYGIDNTKYKLLNLIIQGKIMSEKYWVATTNPPYMGSKNINPTLLKFIQDKYVIGKADIYGAFILKILNDFLVNDGITGLLTPYVWLYLSSFTELREYIIDNTEILSLVQLEYNAFEVACVPVCTYVLRKNSSDYCGRYIQLAKFRGWENQEPKTLAAINDFSLEYCYETFQSKFKLIPTSPIAYWLCESMYEAFVCGEKLNLFGEPRQGMATADNNRFMRLWFEVDETNIDFHCKDNASTNRKWYPHSKGGSLRRWYGNNSFIINWKNNGAEIRNYKNAVVRNPDYYFKPGLTWSDLTVSWFTARMVPEGFTFDSCGPTYFANDEKKLKYICGYFNSWIFQEFLNISCQGMHYSNGIIATLPIIWGTSEQINRIEQLVDENVEISKNDWNANETSWEFSMPFYVKRRTESIRDSIAFYMEKHQKATKQMEKNEEEINSIFAKIFHMESVEPTKGICPPTLNEVTEEQCVVDLISYAVGCIMGRYSLDQDMIVYAGGDWKSDSYLTYMPDVEGVIMFSDDAYFDDDVVAKFGDWIKVVYGADQLENNLEYVASVLKNKGNSSREIIRNYFVSHFYKDHCDKYSVTGSGKRPIYWLFDSGKQNGFKCLIYMHRYNKDTLNLIRSEYLHKTQNAVENALKNAEYIIQSSASAVERAKATKDKDKYVKQLNEMRIYYQALSHLALQKIEIDLDDGVKHNYQLFQGIEVIADGGKKQKVDLLAKI